MHACMLECIEARESRTLFVSFFLGLCLGICVFGRNCFNTWFTQIILKFCVLYSMLLQIVDVVVVVVVVVLVAPSDEDPGSGGGS